MTIKHALTLAEQIGAGESAKATFYYRVLGNTRARIALAKRILRQTTNENRRLFDSFYGADPSYLTGWTLLFAFAADTRMRQQNP